MLDKPVSGFHSWSCSESHSRSHTTLQSKAEFVGVWSFGRLIFSQQKGRERESLEWLEGLRWERAEWKQMSETLTAKSACVCLCVCVFGSRTVITGPRLILKCQSPTAARCSYLVYHFISLLSSLYFSLFPSLWLTEVWRGNGDVQERWSASQTESHHI